MRALDPLTGEYTWDDTRQFFASASDALQLVIRELRTPRGQCPLDPAKGVVLPRKGDSTAAAQLRASIESALGRYVAAGRLSDLAVQVDASGRDRLLYSVSFRDPSNPTVQPVRLRREVTL